MSTDAQLAVALCSAVLVIAAAVLAAVRLGIFITRAGSAFTGSIGLLLTVHVGLQGALVLHEGQRSLLFFDEDQYASMASMLLRADPPAELVGWDAGAPVTAPAKWPSGFPALLSPGVLMVGPDAGGGVFNRMVGVVTGTAIGWIIRVAGGTLVLAVLASVLAVAHPLVSPWFGAGSAEPLTALLLMGSVWLSSSRRSDDDGSLVMAALLLAIACHVRLESVIGLPWLAAAAVRSHRAGRTAAEVARRNPAEMALVLALLLLLALHALGLGEAYGGEREDSYFALAETRATFLANVRFAWIHLGWTWLLLAGVLTAVALVRAGPARSGLAALVAVAALHAAVLATYPPGRLELPGGSRFLLLGVQTLTLGAALALVDKRTLAQVGIAALAAALPWGPATRAVHDLSTPAAKERAWIMRTAERLPDDAVVLSTIPFVWYNFGRAATRRAADIMPAVRPSFAHSGVMGAVAELDCLELAPTHEALDDDGPATLFRIVANDCP